MNNDDKSPDQAQLSTAELPKAVQAEPQSNEDNEQQAAPPPAARSNKLISLLLLCLLGGATGASLYFYQELQRLQQKHHVTAESQQTLNDSLQQETNAIDAELATVTEQLARLADKQTALADSVTQLSPELRSERHYALKEIAHLLTIANDNLELDDNITTAIAALETADKRLLELDGPKIIAVRRQLIADINQLKSLNQADISGLSLFLSDLIDRIDTLPIKQAALAPAPAAEEASGADDTSTRSTHGFFMLIWQELKSLVVITREKSADKARLLPSEIYFVRANIKLELANARLAIFNRDKENLQGSIQHIKQWLQDYFDVSDAAVRNIDEALTQMQTVELTVAKPDISASLTALQALLQYQEQQ